MGDVRVISPDGTSGSVPEADLASALAQGFRLEGAGDTVAVVSPDGQTGTIPAADASAALGQGYRLRSEWQREQDLTSAGSVLATAAEGVAQGASLGMTEPLARVETIGSLLGDLAFRATTPADELEGRTFETRDQALARTREEIQARAEANPGANVAGQVAGAIGATVLSAGGNLALSGGTGLAVQAGERLGALAATRVGSGALTQAATRLFTQGAVEGALFSAAQEVDGAFASGDWDGIAQRAAAAGATGALVGGAVGVGAGAAFAGAGRIMGRLRSAQRGAPSAADSAAAAPAAAPAAAAPAADVVEEVAGEISEAIGSSPAGRLSTATRTQQRNAVAAGVEAKARLAGEPFDREVASMADDLSVMLEAADHISEAGLKSKNLFARELAEADWALPAQDLLIEGRAQFAQARQVLGALDDRYGGQIVDRGAGGQLRRLVGRKSRKGAESIMDDLESRFERAAADGDSAEMFRAMDAYKREVGRAAIGARDNAIKDELADVYEGLRAHLEDSSVWGERMAEAQRRYNRPWSETIRQSSSFERMFGADLGEQSARWTSKRNLAEGSLDKSRSFLEGLRPTFEGDLAGRAASDAETLLRRHAASLDDLVTAFRGNPGVRRDLLDRASAAAKRMGSRVDEYRLLHKRAERLDEMAKIAGAMPVVGPALARMQQAGLTQRLAQPFRSAVDHVAAGAAGVQRRVNAAASTRAGRLFFDAQSGLKTRPAGRMVTVEALEKRMADLEPGGKIYERVDTQAQALEDEGAPELALAQRQHMQVTREFLRSKMPQLAGMDVFGRSATVGARAERKLGRYLDAVDHPLAAVDRVAAGVHTAEDLEVLRELYPAVMADLAAKVATKLATSKKLPDRRTRAQLHQSLGLPVAPGGSTGYALWLQAMQQAEQAAPGGASAPAARPAAPRAPRAYNVDGEGMATGGDRAEAL